MLIRHYEPLNFLLCKRPLRGLLEKLAVSSAKYQCFVLLASIFDQKLFLAKNVCCHFFMGYLFAAPELGTLEVFVVQEYSLHSIKKVRVQ